MRADRLLSLLMLLQTHGKLSAKNLAHKLEVSERTIYRDIVALSTAGVPVYSETGRDGGFALVDHYRTNLTGLNQQEVRALFMLSIPAPLTELGIGQGLQTALLKLSAALPDTRRLDQRKIRERFYLDPTWQEEPEEPVPHLKMIELGVWEDRQLTIRYRPLHILEMERIVNPYGLVARAGVWYMICEAEGQIRVYRVSELRDVQITENTFERPINFDLIHYWENWLERKKSARSNYLVLVRISEKLIPELPYHFGNWIHSTSLDSGPPDKNGWIQLAIPFGSLEDARTKLLGFGNSVEVLDPVALRISIEDYARQITALYSP